MSLDRMMKDNRLQELRAIFRFIKGASIMEVAQIISEIRVCHDNILVFNERLKSVDKVESISINGDCLQLNLENNQGE